MDSTAYEEMSRTEGVHWWFKARREIIDMTIRAFALPRDARILEVGVGTGGNLRMLSGHGRLFGLEMDRRGLAMARNKTGHEFDLVCGKCPDSVPFRDSTFDLVCMLDVLEHVNDDFSTLQRLRHCLVPTGRLLITVPAYQWLWSAHDVHLHHFRRYTSARVKELLGRSGYEVTRITYFNTLLLPLAAVARLADRVRHRSAATGSEIPAPALNAILYRVFRSEKLWLRSHNMPFGVSLLAIAKPARSPSDATLAG